MKRRLYSVIVIIVMGLSVPVCSANLRGFRLAQENEFLRLYVQEETADFAVKDIFSGEVWFSSPQNLDQERIKRGNARNVMRSSLVLNYFTPKREGKSLSSFVDSVQNGEFSVTIASKEVRFDFTLGKQWSEQAYYPIFIEKDRFEALLDRVEDAFDRELLVDSYSLLSFEEQVEYPYEKVSIFGLDLPKYFGNYEVRLLSGSLESKKLGLRNEPHERIKYFLERLSDTMVTYRSDVDRRGLLTAEDFKYVFSGPFYVLLDETYAIYNRAEFARIFSGLGYRPKDVIGDHLAHNVDPPRPNPQVFKIPLVLELDGPSLLVTVPAEEIVYPRDIPDADGSLETFYPYSIDLLPYFGAAPESSDGYIFVPERSGALIQITNPKKNNLPAYSGPVYGVDRSIAPHIEKIAQGPAIYLPVFGLAEENRAFFTILEKGASLAYVNAESGGRSESFAKVYARFALTPRASITLFGVETSLDDKMVDAYAVLPYQGQITERITFLTGDQANYVGMAQFYREYLVDSYNLQKIMPDEDIPLVVELIGGIHDFAPSFGAPREIVRPLTTYQNVIDILADFHGQKIEKVRVRYLGWSKGGIKHYYPKRIVLEKALGSSSDFQELLTYSREHSVELYLDIDFFAVYRDTLFDGFRSGRDASRYLNRTAVKIWDYNIATFQRLLDSEAYATSPRVWDELVNSFLGALSPYQGANLALRRLGQEIYSDFVDKAPKMVHRPSAEQIVVHQMEKIKASGRSLLVTGGNVYAFPYVKQIIEAPEATSPLLIVDKNVPFYQLVLHGYLDFSGQAFNVGDITRSKLLRSLETGELPFFRWSYGDSSLIKGTDFEYLLAINYFDTRESALKLYHEVATVLRKVRGQVMVNHEELSPALFRTTYENGVQVYVNYNSKQMWWAGLLIPGQGYLVTERGDI